MYKRYENVASEVLTAERAKIKPIESLCAVDHSARGSMKNAAKCET